MVGAQLYECKQRFSQNNIDSFSHVDAQPFLLLKEELQNGTTVPNYIQGWIPLQDVKKAVKVELGVGFHKVWRTKCKEIPTENWPNGGHKALNILKYVPELNSMMIDITDEVNCGDLVVFHTMIPHRFTQLNEGIRRDTYVNYDWYLDGQFQGNNTLERY
jgi:hypothetical protein